jgi:hypothetical protein
MKNRQSLLSPTSGETNFQLDLYSSGCSQNQGCQMAYFQTKCTNLGTFWKDLQWMMVVYFMAILSILWPFGIFCGHLVYFMVIWNIFSQFGMLYQEKSGNPAQNSYLVRNILAYRGLA